MSAPRPSGPWLAAIGTLLFAVVALLASWEVRHSAPFGFNLTFDAERGIAVRGGAFRPNFPGLDRVDLDLRAYNPSTDYDLTLYIRPSEPGAAPVRSIPLPLPADRIWHEKGAFASPFLSVRFPPLADSAGRDYYLWLDAGPRHRDDVVTLWSFKTYSRAHGWAILAAALDRPPWPIPTALWRGAVAATLLLLLAAFAWLLASLLPGSTNRPLRPTERSGARPGRDRRGTTWRSNRPPSAMARDVRDGPERTPVW